MNLLAVSRMMAQGVADGVFPGGVLLCARGPEILYHQAFGLADIREERPVGIDSVFDLASLTKPLAVAAAMMVLVQEKRLGLDTLLREVLPVAGDSPKALVTMEMLLRHTSGLPAHREYFMSVASGPDGVQALGQLILKESLETAPGQCQVYSDLGYMLLAWIIETVTNTRLDRFVRDHVYVPLGIDDLFFIDVSTNRIPVRRSRLVSTRDCPWRGRVLTGEVEDENAWATGGIQGHAGLFGDAVSIYMMCLEILQAIRGQSIRLLDPEVVVEFVGKHPGQILVAGFDTPSGKGSSAGRFFSSRAVGHLGFTGTSFWMDPDPGLLVILLTNRVHPSRSNRKIKQFRPALHDCIAGCL